MEAFSTTLIDCGKAVYKKWIMQTNATNHICYDLSMFSAFTPSVGRHDNIVLLDGSKCPVIGRGSVIFTFPDGSVRTLSDVLYVPNMKCNVICVGILASQGYGINFESEKMTVFKDSKEVMAATVDKYCGYCLNAKTFTRKPNDQEDEGVPSGAYLLSGSYLESSR